jgi:hypothetical protein
MIEYILSGESIKVSPEDEKQFLADNPDAKIAGAIPQSQEQKEDYLKMPSFKPKEEDTKINQSPSSNDENINVEEPQAPSGNEADPPKKNLKKNKETKTKNYDEITVEDLLSQIEKDKIKLEEGGYEGNLVNYDTQIKEYDALLEGSDFQEFRDASDSVVNYETELIDLNTNIEEQVKILEDLQPKKLDYEAQLDELAKESLDQEKQLKDLEAQFEDIDLSDPSPENFAKYNELVGNYNTLYEEYESKGVDYQSLYTEYDDYVGEYNKLYEVYENSFNDMDVKFKEFEAAQEKYNNLFPDYKIKEDERNNLITERNNYYAEYKQIFDTHQEDVRQYNLKSRKGAPVVNPNPINLTYLESRSISMHKGDIAVDEYGNMDSSYIVGKDAIENKFTVNNKLFKYYKTNPDAWISAKTSMGWFLNNGVWDGADYKSHGWEHKGQTNEKVLEEHREKNGTLTYKKDDDGNITYGYQKSEYLHGDNSFEELTFGEWLKEYDELTEIASFQGLTPWQMENDAIDFNNDLHKGPYAEGYFNNIPDKLKQEIIEKVIINRTHMYNPAKQQLAEMTDEEKEINSVDRNDIAKYYRSGFSSGYLDGDQMDEFLMYGKEINLDGLDTAEERENWLNNNGLAYDANQWMMQSGLWRWVTKSSMGVATNVTKMGYGLLQTVESEALMQGVMEGKTIDQMVEEGDISKIRKLQDGADELANMWSTKYFDEKGEIMTPTDLISEGRVWDAAQVASEQAISNVYSFALTAWNPLFGAAIIGTSVYGQELSENLETRFIDEGIRLKPGDKTTLRRSALLNAGSEFIGEYIGGKLFRYGSNMIRGGASKDVVKEFTDNYISTYVKGFFYGFGAEGSSEALTAYLQDEVDVHMWGDEIDFKQRFENISNSFIIGGLLGGPITSTTNIMGKPSRNDVLVALSPLEWRQEVASLEAKKQETINQIDKSKGSTKAALEKRLELIDAKLNAKNKQLQSVFEHMSNKELTNYAKKYKRLNELYKTQRNTDLPQDMRDEAKGEIETILNDLNSVTKSFVNVEVEKSIGDFLANVDQIRRRGGTRGFGSDLKIKYLDTSEEVDKALKEKGIDKKASNSDGLFYRNVDGKSTIYVNVPVAAATGQTNVLGHELLHYIMSKNFKTNNAAMRPMVTALTDFLGETDEGKAILNSLNTRLANNGYLDQNGRIKEGNLEEYLELLTDLMDKNEMPMPSSKPKSLASSLKDIMTGFGFGTVNLDTGEQIFDFLKTYTKNVNRKGRLGEITKRRVGKVKIKSKLYSDAQVKAQAARGRGSRDETVAQKESKSEQSEQDIYTENTLQELGQSGWDNVNWKTHGTNFAVKTIQDEKLLDRLIAAQLKVPMSPARTKDFINKVLSELTPHIKRFDPTINDNLFGWINSQIGNKATAVYNREYKPGQRTVDIDAKTPDGALIYQPISEDLTPEEMMIAKQESESDQKKTKKTLAKILKLDNKLIQEFIDALTLAFGTKLPEVAINRKQAKIFEKELLKIVTDKVRIKIQKLFGTELAYNEFIKNDLLPLLNLLPSEALRDMEKMVGGKKYPNGRKILATQVKLGRKKDVEKYQKKLDAQGKPMVPLTVDPAKAAATKINVPIRLPNPTSQELLAFFRGTNAEAVLGYQPPGAYQSGMLGARKDKVAELLTREIAKDYAMKVIRDPKVMQKITNIEALQNRIIKDSHEAEIGVILDRAPDAGYDDLDINIKYSKSEVIDQLRFLVDLSVDLGYENVIDDNGNFLLNKEFPEMSALAIQKLTELEDAGVIEEIVSARFKSGVQKLEGVPQSVKDDFENVGNLKYNTPILDQLEVDMQYMAINYFGPEVMKATGYEIIGYKNRILNSPEKVVDKEATRKNNGKTIYKKDENGNFISGEYYERKQVTIKKVGKVKKTKIPLDKNLVLKDVRIFNKSKPVFKKVIKVQDKTSTKADKLKDKEYTDLIPEIENANLANILLAKHILKSIVIAVRKKQISPVSALNFLQMQTSIVNGIRGLSRLDLVEFLDGSQAANSSHPDFKEAIIYYKSKGIRINKGETLESTVIKKKLVQKGEHTGAMSNTSLDVVPLFFNNADIDTSLDLILNAHSQTLTSVYKTDVIDDGPGGSTSRGEFKRYNVLKPQDQANFIGINGQSLEDVRIERGISKIEAEIVVKASTSHNKYMSMQDAINNRIKYSKTGKAQGMSTFDFDDTLARTKSGIRYTIPNNTGKPMPGKKVIFLAGSAGSGKSNVVKQLGLEKQGYKMVNQDISLEWLAKNSGLPTDMRDFTPEQASKWGSLQWEARDIAQRKATKFRGRGDGVIVDGTGASTVSMFTQVQKYKDAGYDVQMLFVDSSLETALTRNQTRKERSLKDFIVTRNWESVQKNKKAFKEEFGDNFAEVNTDKLKQGDPMPKSLVNKMDKFTNSYIKGRLTAEEFANKGGDLLDQGAKFDFSEFNKVVDGTPGPLLDKARNRAKKYGTKDMFVLTARPQQSAFAIQQFLKGQGLDIPIENITGLANSTGEAKAQWMLDKFAEGYNDMYFVDDAIQNVKAVKQVLDQLDIKSEVVQAKIKFSKSASREFNEIIEQSQGTKADKIISQAEAMKTGKNKGWWRFFVPPSAEDFKGLMYRFLGTGKQGEQHMEWFKENLLDPFAKGIRSWNAYKQGMVNEWKQLKKDFKSVHKSLYKNVAGTKFTTDAAIRVYLWDKAGFDIPGLDTETKNKLISYVKGNTKVKQYADTLSKITRTKEGYIQPKEGWSVGTIASDLNDIVTKVGRKQFLQDWIENKNAIFNPDNMNKIEALYGTNFKKALENILYRMENGTNRRLSPDSNVNALLDWINGSVGAIMFFNMRSATLQTLSTVNFINWNDNNIFKAAKAFANQKQFWKDFAMLFNSPQLKQRRKGIQTDVSAAELSSTFAGGKASPRKVINYLLQLGFTPTQIVDSVAIAFGGASFYRNRFDTYKKQGMTDKQASDKAMLDFQEIAEETQQSSREDMVSQQQASVLGRVVLAFQNTTMQYTRLTKKALSDLVNRRGDPKTHISKIAYYGAVQSIVFLALQQALAQSLWGDDEEELDKDLKRVFNGALESFLSGTGIHGKIVSTIKNTVGTYQEEKAKPKWKRENANVLLEVLSFSPPIGSKLRKIWQALQAEYYDDDGKLSEELGFRIESPKLYFWTSLIEAATNIPLQRLVRKANNIEEAITSQHSLLNRIMLGMGWSVWDLGIKDEDTVAAKERVAEKKEIEKEEKKKEDKIIKEQEKEEEKKREEEEKKAKGIKTIRCSGIRSNGERCGNTTETADKTWKCYHHMDFTDGDDRDGDGIKEYRCTAIKKNGDRCKNKTENESKKCYAHQ